MKPTNEMVENYLIDYFGYDEFIMDEIKSTFQPLSGALDEEETKECINYYL